MGVGFFKIKLDLFHSEVPDESSLRHEAQMRAVALKFLVDVPADDSHNNLDESTVAHRMTATFGLKQIKQQSKKIHQSNFILNFRYYGRCF